MKKLDKNFYTKSAIEIAPLLLGKLFCHKIDGKIYKYLITETECYYGIDDTASHAYRGITNRNKIMYEEGGVSYIYLCYGIHHLFNVVTGPKDHPEAVLIRGIENASGPGRVTKLLNIDKSFNGSSLINSNLIWIEDDGFIPKYTTSKRIGIDYATKEYINKKWRFLVK